MDEVSKHNCHYKLLSEQHQNSLTNHAELDTSALVELLQLSAVEHLTTHRQLQVQRFGSLQSSHRIITTVFDLLYAYKRGDYQQCLQWSTHNIHSLLYANDVCAVSTFPEFVQLLDDDIVSLTAVTLIVNPGCRDNPLNVLISQLTLSLYLMTQCQLKLRHSVTSLVQTVNYIKVAQRRHPARLTLVQLTLKLTKYKVLTYIEKMLVSDSF